jgi:hypothetical protein
VSGKDLQDAFMEGFSFAEDIGHTTGKKLAEEAERRYPKNRLTKPGAKEVDHTIMSKYIDHKDNLD